MLGSFVFDHVGNWFPLWKNLVGAVFNYRGFSLKALELNGCREEPLCVKGDFGDCKALCKGIQKESNLYSIFLLGFCKEKMRGEGYCEVVSRSNSRIWVQCRLRVMVLVMRREK